MLRTGSATVGGSLTIPHYEGKRGGRCTVSAHGKGGADICERGRGHSRVTEGSLRGQGDEGRMMRKGPNQWVRGGF